MPKKPSKAGSKEPPAKPEPTEPATQHLHDEQRRPLKAPVGGVPPNLPKQFPGKGPKQFGNLVQGKGRNFRHQGR
jgi:hypothetical protein